MTDRLNQIWKGFAQTTRARLTSHELSGMARPSASRRDENGFDAAATMNAGRADQSDAVKAAFETLHAEIAEKARRSRGGRRGEPRQGFDATPADLSPPSGLDDRLLADIKFTEARVRRSGSDYLSYARDRQVAWQKRKRKKFLGLF